MIGKITILNRAIHILLLFFILHTAGQPLSLLFSTVLLLPYWAFR
jgi:hypothetical protein